MTTKRKTAAAAGLMALAFALTSCRTPSSGITLESYPSNKITINSRMVGARLHVAEYAARKRGDLLQVQISVRNPTRTDCQFEYRFEWKDADGVAVATPMSVWTPFSISSKETKLLQAVAPAKEAVDFVFIVRFSRPSTRW